MKTRLLPLIGVLLLVPALALADADGDLDKAIASGERDAIRSALKTATSNGDVKAAQTILRVALKLRGLDCHQTLLDAIKGIKDEAAVTKLAEAAKNNGQADLRYLLVEGLALQGSPAAGKAVLDALDDKDDAVQVVAARGARHVGTPETVDRLIATLEKAEKSPKEASFARELNAALAALTGENLSFALEWKGWWLSHKQGWSPKKDEAGNDDKGGDTVMRRIAKDRPADAKTIERMAQDDVIVVKGQSDSVEQVLKAIGVKHTVIKKDKFAETKLDPKSVLILNCDGRKDPYPEDQIARIREFVDKGGYLFSSDWELEHTIQRAFPDSIEKGGLSSKKREDTFKCDIRPVDAKHPLLRDVFALSTWDAASLTWHMEGSSHLIKIAAPEVQTLITSQELGKRFPDFPAVAVTFRWKGGKVVKPKTATGGASASAQGGSVLHVLSHFKLQKDKDSGDKFALQQLLLNFFLEKQAANKQK